MSKSKFKVGDEVICKPGYSKSDIPTNKGGMGYIPGHKFTVNTIHPHSNSYIYWAASSNGVWEQALELQLKPEDEKFNKLREEIERSIT